MKILHRGAMTVSQTLMSDADLRAAGERYHDFEAAPLSYATVRDYCDSFDHLRTLATANGDLKDSQRPWVLKAILGATRGRRQRFLEIGAGEPLVAALLERLGNEVWVVDPYDGSGNGPTDYERYRADYPRLHFVREQFGPDRAGVKPGSVDCVYSISVLEHIPPTGLLSVMAGMKRFLRPDGVSIHAVDHVHRGRGADEHLANLRIMANAWGVSQAELDAVLAALTRDTDTYYLSAESHNRWRGSVPYDDFPMRVCVSVQALTKARDIGAEG